jgi:hypothetical protein
MEATPFDLEVDFQRLLEEHPGLIPGELVDEDEPRRWLLIGREAPVVLGDEGGSRGSLDHLFIDQDGWPTLVEVKRASDTRGRREVVAQMLDYAANLGGWEVGELRTRFEQRCSRAGQDPDEVLDRFLAESTDGETDLDGFWSTAQANLDAGRMRLIFLSDRIRPELQRIIEFLNEHLDTIQVLGVEVKQWTVNDVAAYSSSVVGQTIKAADRKRRAIDAPVRLTDEQFAEALDERTPAQEAEAVRAMFSWCEANGGYVSYGQGARRPAAYLNWDGPARTIWALIIIIGPKSQHVRIPLNGLRRWAAPEDAEAISAFVRTLDEIDGVAMAGKVNPTFPLSVLTDPARRDPICVAVAELVGALTKRST